MKRAVLAAILLSSPLGACSTDAQGSLVGTWTYSGSVPARVTITLTLKTDRTFTFVEQVAPFSEPAGFDPGGCVTTDTYSGTYAETSAGGTDALMWTFAGGTANAVSRCNDATHDNAGTPMTADAIASSRDQGLIPPAAVTYAVTSAALVLNPSGGQTNATGLGARASVTFTKVGLAE